MNKSYLFQIVLSRQRLASVKTKMSAPSGGNVCVYCCDCQCALLNHSLSFESHTVAKTTFFLPMANCGRCRRQLRDNVFNFQNLHANCHFHCVCWLTYLEIVGFNEDKRGWSCSCGVILDYNDLEQIRANVEALFEPKKFEAFDRINNALENRRQGWSGLRGLERAVRNHRQINFEIDTINSLFLKIFAQFKERYFLFQ